MLRSLSGSILTYRIHYHAHAFGLLPNLRFAALLVAQILGWLPPFPRVVDALHLQSIIVGLKSKPPFFARSLSTLQGVGLAVVVREDASRTQLEPAS